MDSSLANVFLNFPLQRRKRSRRRRVHLLTPAGGGSGTPPEPRRVNKTGFHVEEGSRQIAARGQRTGSRVSSEYGSLSLTASCLLCSGRKCGKCDALCYTFKGENNETRFLLPPGDHPRLTPMGMARGAETMPGSTLSMARFIHHIKSSVMICLAKVWQ